jgi:hypothetical protein
MRFPSTSSRPTLRVITTILNFLMASLLLPLGIGNLINPDVADSSLNLNTRVCLVVIFTGVVSIYTLFRPYSGGVFLCICAVVLGFVSRVFDNPLSIAILLLGGLSVICGRLSRRTRCDLGRT